MISEPTRKVYAMRVLALLLGLVLLPLPAVAGLPYRTDDGSTTEAQHWEVDFFSSGTSVRGGTVGVLPGLDVEYGVIEGVQIHIILPLGYASGFGRPTRFGNGDTELGVKLQLPWPDKDSVLPQIAIFPLVEVPSGNQHLGFSTGHTQIFLPVWIGKDIGDWNISAGGGHWTNPGAGNKDWWYAGGVVQRRLGEDLTVGAEVFHQTASVEGGKPSTGFNVGATYQIREGVNLLALVGRGLQNAATTNTFSYYTALQFNF